MAIIAVFLLLVVAVVIADITYINRVNEAFVKFGEKIKPKQFTTFTLAQNTMTAHLVLMCVTAVATVLQPVYIKFIKKINTSVELEETSVANIELADEE